MVEPEVDHLLLELALGVDVAQELDLDILRANDAAGTVEGGEDLKLLRGEAGEELIALGGRQGLSQRMKLGEVEAAERLESFVRREGEDLGRGLGELGEGVWLWLGFFGIGLLLLFFLDVLLLAVVVDGVAALAAGDARLVLECGANLLVGGVELHQLVEGKLHRGIGGEAGVEGAVVDGVGAELLLEPGAEADGAQPRQVAGARAVGEAVEDEQKAFVAGNGVGDGVLWRDSGGGVMASCAASRFTRRATAQ